MSNMDFLSKALALHTKGKDASFLKEAKDYNKDGKIDDHEKDHDKEEDRFEKIEKDVGMIKKDHKDMKKEETEVEEASVINGKKQDPNSERWKSTGLSHDDAIAKHGKENVRKGMFKRNDGSDDVQVKARLGEESLTEAENVAMEIIDKLTEHYDEAIHLQSLLENLGYDLEELFSIDEEADEELEEGFANVSLTKRLIAQRKAAMRRRLGQGAKKPKKPGMPKR